MRQNNKKRLKKKSLLRLLKKTIALKLAEKVYES